ncbi:MAG: rRNA methyltransferase [Bacteroidetes bacterium]|nr:rRNA methyltransferase [Bacteroidota bacterium]
MPHAKKNHPILKPGLHERNKHRERYNFNELAKTCPDLMPFVKLNDYGDESIDFFNPDAVKTLNKALLKHYYDIDYWDIPDNYLCPPIPGRADYIHHIADLLNDADSRNRNKIPQGNTVKCLDIGVGANCVYPIIGTKEYGWSFIGSDCDQVALNNAAKIIELNARLNGQVELRFQSNPKHIFKGIIQKNEFIDLTLCNPPFHRSHAEAQSASIRKQSNLKGKRVTKSVLNFGGQNNELWYDGGEAKFIDIMINESREFSKCCFWFSVLVSKQSTLNSVYQALKMMNATEVKTISISHGNKMSRTVAWTFLDKKEQNEWVQTRWK